MFRNQKAEVESRSEDDFDDSYSENFQMTNTGKKTGTKQKSQRS